MFGLNRRCGSIAESVAASGIHCKESITRLKESQPIFKRKDAKGEEGWVRIKELCHADRAKRSSTAETLYLNPSYSIQ